ncbi:hypothetical protein DH2020_042287 [Rehmannia glutinosa]|uniref:eIF-4F 25 kDa subunit n=1 Tax=Rehmannia glutinosa TaxID=99300 RepID=A0ABR0UP30_REHGL
MVEETEKLATTAMKEEVENSSSVEKNHHIAAGEDSETEEGEIVGGDSDDPAKAMAAAAPPRHPLEHAWTFWFDNPSAKSKQAAWGSSIRPIYTFASVEDFWRYFSIFHFYSIVRFLHLSVTEGLLLWLLAMIGEQFDYRDEICGAVVNVRAGQEKISIWTKNAVNEAAQDDAKRLDRGAKNRYTV